MPATPIEEQIPIPKFHRTFEPKTFKATFADLSAMITAQPETAGIASPVGRGDHGQFVAKAVPRLLPGVGHRLYQVHVEFPRVAA